MLLALTALLIAGAAGQASQQAPQPCCTSHQFTAIMGEVGGALQNGMPMAIDGFEFVTYDYDAKLIAATNHLKDAATGTYTNTSTLTDYNAMKTYIFADGGNCFFTTTDQPMPEPCVPANATFMAAVTLGSGQSTIKANVWEAELPGTQASIRLVISADNCTPLIQAIFASEGDVRSETTYVFTNFESTIANRTVLAIPAADQCQPLPTANPQDPAVGRRAVPFS